MPRPKMSPFGAPPTLEAMTRRIGLLGGTFDPPHLGHLSAARAVRGALNLDEVRLVVANDPWQKSGTRAISPAAVRVEMTRALVDGEPGLSVDTCEVERGGPTYTMDTLVETARSEPGAELFLVVGSDTASRICSWNRASELDALSTLVVVNRPFEPSRVPGCIRAERCVFVTMDEVDISSTDIRRTVASGEPAAAFTGEAVARVIGAHRLYEAPR